MALEFRDISAAAFERLAQRLVDRAFADLPDDPDVPLPWIGSWPYIEERVVKKQTVVAALCATRWFELEAPPWAQPLLLKPDDCYAMFNGQHQGNLRSRLRGEYGLYVRERRWSIEGAKPFEVFSADVISPWPAPSL